MERGRKIKEEGGYTQNWKEEESERRKKGEGRGKDKYEKKGRKRKMEGRGKGQDRESGRRMKGEGRKEKEGGKRVSLPWRCPGSLAMSTWVRRRGCRR